MGIKPATFVYLRVLKTDQLSLLSWASSSSWNTGVCSGSLESLSFHSRITASVQKEKVSWSIKSYFPEILPSMLFMHITSVYHASHTVSSWGKQLSIWAKAHHIDSFGMSRQVGQKLDDCFSVPILVHTPQLQNQAKIYYTPTGDEIVTPSKKCNISPHKSVIKNISERNSYSCHEAKLSYHKDFHYELLVHIHAHQMLIVTHPDCCVHSSCCQPMNASITAVLEVQAVNWFLVVPSNFTRYHLHTESCTKRTWRTPKYQR